VRLSCAGIGSRTAVLDDGQVLALFQLRGAERVILLESRGSASPVAAGCRSPEALCAPAKVQITPSARILRMLGEVESEEWKCLAELIDNAFDDFNEIMIFVILERSSDDIDSHYVPASSPPPEPNFFTIAVAACPLLALLLSAGLLSRALKRHRFRVATFHSSRILP
jgi:hypothetical protein